MTPIVFGSEEANRIAKGARPRQVVTAGGLIEFDWWPDAPSIYATETQLKRAGLKPGGPAVARVSYGQGRKAVSYLLYDGRAAVPRKEATPAQQAAIEKAQLVRRTCVECGAVKERSSDLDEHRVCWPCVYWAEAYRHQQDRDAAIGWARRTLQDGTALILDTETVSLHGFACEISCIDLAGTVVFDTLINPQVPNEATHIHGITDAMTASALTFADIEPELRRVLQGRQVIVYNADYDRGVLRNELERLYERDHPKPPQALVARPWDERDIWRTEYDAWRATLDTWEAERDRARTWFNTIDWTCAMLEYSAFCGDYSQKYADYRFQRLPGAGHRALGDCRACLEVIEHMAASPTTIEQRLVYRGARVYDTPAKEEYVHL
jgi:DNA polymerase III epsilon subunit-like protein